MTNDSIKYVIGGMLIGGVVVWSFMTSMKTENWRGMPEQRLLSDNHMPMTSQIDAHFIEQMIPHHQDAITMATLALTKAQRPKIKELSESIIESQSQEIDQMKAWYMDWYGQDVPEGAQMKGQHGMMDGGLHMGMMGDQTDIERLELADDFDRAFIEEMIPHHQMAVMMANMLKSGTERPEMKQLANDIITAQTREISEMREWYGAWY